MTDNPHQEACRQLADLYQHHATSGTRQTVQRQHAKGKLTVHERLDLLLDKDAPRFEVGTFAAMGQYREHGEITSAGVRTVIGRVRGRDCMVVANDSLVKSGAWFPLTVKKILRSQEICIQNRLPVIYLVDSGGIYLPLQDEVFADRDHGGRIFYYNAKLSAMGVQQIAAVVGSCVAGGAYLPALCDEIIMVKGTSGIFLGGPHLVKAAIGETTDAESLGGSHTHTALSGMADYEEPDEAACLHRVRELVRQWPRKAAVSYAVDAPRDPARSPMHILACLPGDMRASYDMRPILECIVDQESWEEYKSQYGRTLLTGTARLDGRWIGIIANQRLQVKDGNKAVQIGGVIYSDSADKAARFVLRCNQKQLPILFLQDVTGFMVGTHAEQGGIIKDGAKLVNAISNSRVPLITLVIGNSNGAGNYALCGRSYGPRFMLAWPTAHIAVMGGEQAAETILAIEKSKAQKPLSKQEEEEILQRLTTRYAETASPYYAASRLWIDAVIDPRDTRTVLSHLLEITCLDNPDEDFKLGVFQV